MFRTYRQIWALLSGPERRNFILLMLLSMVAAAFEVVGVAGILPFLSVLADPGLIGTHPLLIGFADLFGLTDPDSIKVALGMAVLGVILIGMAVRAAVTWVQIRFSVMRAYSLGARLLAGYLRQDYVFFLSRNSAELSQSVLSEIDTVIRESLLATVLLLSNVMVVVLIAGLLFVVEPWVAIGATLSLTSVYLVIYYTLRPMLGRISQARLAANRGRFRVVSEIAGGIKELKVTGQEAASLQRFCSPAQEMARQQTRGQLIARLPRFALEAAVYGGFVAMVLVMILVRGQDLAALVPLLGLIGMAALKMFPALQQLYQQLSAIRFSAAALEKLHRTMAEFAATPPAPPPAPEPMTIERAIELDGLVFRYPGAEADTLRGLTATIPARATVGVVGGTGAGKTTLIDIVMGLLTPAAGEMRIDGVPLTPARVRAWQARLGYVPQAIYLSDATVAENIAFGTPPSRIDRAAVERAACIANLHDFVMADLPQGYDTVVGERGVRLSGGQRQRIGIARALYHDPDVLVLDEATSALDNLTERAVMEAVHNLGGAKTVIMIAHRLTTVQDCDLILMLDKGRVAAQGTYAELVSGNDTFRRMAGE